MTMPARAYHSPAPPAEEDFCFPESVPTLKVKVRCRCGVRSITNFRICLAFVQRWMAGERIQPTDLAGSSWCRDCKTLVKVTAGALHLSTCSTSACG